MNYSSNKSRKKVKVETVLNEDQILDIQNLLQVEGGVDNDEDWCIIGQCHTNGQKNCYTGA
jgi:hypothetical protein